MRPQHVLAAVVVTAATALSGCATSESPDAPPSSSEQDLERAGRELTRSEVEEMLPAVPDDGEKADASEEPTGLRSEPAQCLDVLFSGDAYEQLADTDPAEASVYWQTGEGPSLVGTKVTVSSFGSEVGSAPFTAAGEALGACDAFVYQGRDAQGSFDYRVLASSRPARNIGEQTISVRLVTWVDVNGEQTRYHIDVLHYRVGHNLVTVRETHYSPERGTSDLEHLASRVLSNLRQ